MADLLKFDWKELAAVAIIFLLAFGIGNFPPKATLPDYSTAIAIQGVASGQPAAFHIQVASFFEGYYASFLGMPAGSPDTIVSFLLFWPAKLFALTGVFLYLAIRALGFRKTVAAFSAALFILSQAATLQFLPGVFSSASIAAVFFSLFFLFMALYSKNGHIAWFLLSAAFGALCAYSDFGFGVAALLSSALFAAGAHLKKGKNAAYFAASALVFIAVLAFAPSQITPPSLEGWHSLLSGAPFLAAAASCALVLFAFNSATPESALLALGAIVVSTVSPLSGAILLVVPAAEGISRASEEKLPAIAKLSCAFFLFFFVFFGLASHQYSDLPKSIVLSGTIALLAPLSLHLYEYRGRQFFAVSALSLLSLSLASAAFYPVSQFNGGFPKYSDKDEAAALSYLAGKGAASVCLLGDAQMARFYLPGARICDKSEFASYLRTGQPSPASGTYMQLSLSYIDMPVEYGLYNGTAPFESFSYMSNVSDANGQVALFSSKGGYFLVREIDSMGAFALKDSQIIDQRGTPYASVPLSRMLLLKPESPFSSQSNRVLVIEEGAMLPHFVGIYHGSLSSIVPSGSFGKVILYEVE